MRAIAIMAVLILGTVAMTGCGVCEAMDSDGDGVVTVEEYRTVMQSFYGDTFTEVPDEAYEAAIAALGCSTGS